MPFSTPSVHRLRRKSALLLAAVLGASVLALNVTGAGAATRNVGGQFTFGAETLLDCPLGSVLCTKGNFTGNLAGPFTNVITSLLPSPNAGVSFFSGRLTLHSDVGDLRCGLNGAQNALSTDGEFAEICVVTGGTGQYQGATGHLELTGTSSANPPILGEQGTGTCNGTIRGASIPSS